ncbi:ATP-binding protein [Miniphocaeibacter massiliensis]|uniref:ATP-binding protein n=1 Tax=Miniphocaeibacter massiliensis TaxID=2041841 RepID=UPI000C1BB4B8|nr:ATP-binding protein [Miniphocaeibacter massiliensis]
MNIILEKLTLGNFKGIKNKVIEFKDNITNIAGENASGKTTIYDAYSWLLWNKDSQNKTDFNIKTIGKYGEPLHNLEHSVEGEFLIVSEDEKVPLKLKKVFKEKWTKKRGSKTEEFNGHTTEYFINDILLKLKEYTARIEALITEEKFKQLSNPLHFNINLDTKKKRELVLSLINDVSIDEIIDKNKELEPLRELLATRDINDLMKINKATISNINKDLELLPIKINERYDSKRADIDFDKLEFRKRIIVGTIEKIDNDLAKKNNSEALKDKQLQIKELIIKQENIVNEVEKKNREAKRKYQEEISDRNKKIEHCNTYIKEVETDKKSELKLLETLNAELIGLREKYENYANDKMEIAAETHCPTCNQELPIESIQEKINLIKSNKLSDISDKADGILKKIEIVKKDIQDFDKKIELKKDELKQIQDNIPTEPVEEIIPQEYHDITEQIEKLKEEINNFDVTDNTELLEKKSELEKELGEINSQLAFEKVNEEADKKIAEYEEQQAKLGEEYDRVSEIIYLCEQFMKVKVDYISDDINSKFSLVKFKLFETQINGGINEVCESTVNNVPFNDLNNAMKINAGIDIINTLADHYKINTPIFIDNAESVNHLEETDSQVIRLVVSDDKELVIK